MNVTYLLTKLQIDFIFYLLLMHMLLKYFQSPWYTMIMTIVEICQNEVIQMDDKRKILQSYKKR